MKELQMIHQSDIVQASHLGERESLESYKIILTNKLHELDRFFAKFNIIYDISIESDEKVLNAYNQSFKEYTDISSKIKIINYYLKSIK